MKASITTGRWLAAASVIWLVIFATAYGQAVTVEWNASADPTVVGYNLYYGAASGDYTNEVNAGTNTVLTITGLAFGSTYYFTVTAYDAAGTESAYAPEISDLLKRTPGVIASLAATGITYGQSLRAATISGLVTNAAGGVVPGTFGFTTPATIPAAGSFQASVTFTPTAVTTFSTLIGHVNVAVSPAPLIITALNGAKTYGQTITFGGTKFSVVGLVHGDTLTTVSLASDGATNTAGAGGYPIVPGAILSGSINPANYTITCTPGKLTVSPAALTVTAMAQSKSYGQTVTLGGGSTLFTANGLQNGETVGSVTLAVNGAGASPTAAVAGSPYAIAPSAAIGGSFGPGNYSITYVPGKLTVRPAILTITANAAAKVYGQTMVFGSGSTAFTRNGLQNGETIGTVTLSVSNNGGAATATVAGSPYTITPSAAVGGTFAAGNYTISYAPGHLTITPAALTITANAAAKVYGQTMVFGSGSTAFTRNGLQNGETIGTVTLSVSNNGGAATATVASSPYTITPSAAVGGTFAAGNYTISYAPGHLTIAPATLTITANAAAKVYGQTMVFSSGSTAFTHNGLQNGETIGTVTLAVSNNGGAATATVGESPYTITPSAASGGTFAAGDYAIAYVPGTLTVKPALLTVTPMAQSKAYGQTVVFGSGSTGFTTSGLQNGEIIGAVTMAVSNNGGGATATVAGSPYSITPSVASGGSFAPGNYAITYVSGKLTVTPAALNVTAMAQSKVFGQSLFFGSGSALFTTSGLQNGETIGTVTLVVNNNGGAATAPVGGWPSYIITPSAATGGTFALGNYAISYVTSTLTILPITQALPSLRVALLAPLAPLVVINSPVWQSDGTIRLTFTGGQAGVNYEVQESPDLFNWTTLTNLAADGNGLPGYTDNGVGNNGPRFYRTVTP